MKTAFITGTSSGYGLETARLFHAKGWNVIAAMRTPREDVLPKSDRIHIVPLDVTNADSIKAAVEAAGPIDVLVNNAGIGMFDAARLHEASLIIAALLDGLWLRKAVADDIGRDEAITLVFTGIRSLVSDKEEKLLRSGREPKKTLARRQRQ